jgi:hypothetical protein
MQPARFFVPRLSAALYLNGLVMPTVLSCYRTYCFGNATIRVCPETTSFLFVLCSMLAKFCRLFCTHLVRGGSFLHKPSLVPRLAFTSFFLAPLGFFQRNFFTTASCFAEAARCPQSCARSCEPSIKLCSVSGPTLKVKRRASIERR